MNDSILDDQLLNDDMIGIQLLDAHQYWLKKRLLFNILVGLAGLISLLFLYQS